MNAEAETKGTDAENQIAPNDPSAKKDRTLELLSERITNKAGQTLLLVPTQLFLFMRPTQRLMKHSRPLQSADSLFSRTVSTMFYLP